MMIDTAIKHISEVDNVLKNIIDTIELEKIECTNNVFHDLVSCVIEQQIHCRSTKKIFQKMLDAYKIKLVTPSNFSQFEERGIAGYKLSISKYETLMKVLDFWAIHPDLNWQQLTDEEISYKLSEIKGIGGWTIDMILLYTLQRPNVFPVDDFHLKEIMVSLYKLNPTLKLKSQMLEITEHWGEHKSIAVKYLLAWKSFSKKR
jgi:DNA-3-methyladenine glycosylase II